MTFAAVSGRACPHCQTAEAAQVIESRTTRTGRRRRHACTVCGHRFTTFEIDQVTFDRLQADTQALARIRAALAITTTTHTPEPDATPLPCETCCHGRHNTCDLTIPEAFTQQSIDCPYFRA